MEKVMRWLVIGGTSESLAAVEYLMEKRQKSMFLWQQTWGPDFMKNIR